VRFALKCRANLFPEQAGRSSLLFKEDLRKNFFSGNEKRRLSGEYISQKPPEIVGVGSSSPLNKEKYLFVCT
jgi:hypothetical protein